jgi:hypothetical protein
LQRSLGHSYVKLYLNEEEARLLYDALKQSPHEFNTREGIVTMNLLYRLTEQVALNELPARSGGKRDGKRPRRR